MDSVAIGIDLGTTNSCAAIFRNGSVEIIPNENNINVIPSWVTFTSDRVLVGHEAKDKSHLDVSNSIYEFKRLIGAKYDDEKIQKNVKSVSYQIVNADGIPKIKVNHNGREEKYSPEELSGYILANLKDAAEKHIGKSVDHVVVTVPAYFNAYQRQATKNAAIIADFKTIHIINEPTAAALAFSHHDVKEYKRNVLVYDFGGGTFDVSIVNVGRGECIVKATEGDSHLGGTDIDSNLFNYIKNDFKNQYGIELNVNDIDLRRVKNICETVKKRLSGQQNSTGIEISRLSGQEYFTIITKDEFDELNREIFERTLNITKNCLSKSGFFKDDINEVVLVGGSSRNLKVQSMLKEYFGEDKISHGINADEAVAYGAAIHANQYLSGDKLEVKDVNSMPLGIEVLDKSFSIVIPQNTPIPETSIKTYSTISQDTSINVHQGVSNIACHNFKLGSFVLENADYSQIDVIFELDAEGILKVSAVSKIDESNTNTIVINLKDVGLTSKQIEERTNEIKEFRSNEIIHRECNENKWNLEMLCEVVAETATKNGDKEEVSRCEEIMNWLKTITITDKEEVILKTKVIQNYFYGPSN